MTAVVQLLSHVRLFETSWTAARQASLSFSYLPEFAQTHVHWVSDGIQPSHPLSSPSPSLNLSQQRSLLKMIKKLDDIYYLTECQRWVYIII